MKKKRITTETIYDDSGRILKTIVTEEYDEDPFYDPYNYPYCGPSDSTTSRPLSDNIQYTNGDIPEGALYG